MFFEELFFHEIMGKQIYKALVNEHYKQPIGGCFDDTTASILEGTDQARKNRKGTRKINVPTKYPVQMSF